MKKSFNYRDYVDIEIDNPQERQETEALFEWVASLNDKHNTREGQKLLKDVHKALGEKLTVISTPTRPTGVLKDFKLLQINFNEMKTTYVCDQKGEPYQLSKQDMILHELHHLLQNHSRTLSAERQNIQNILFDKAFNEEYGERAETETVDQQAMFKLLPYANHAQRERLLQRMEKGIAPAREKAFELERQSERFMHLTRLIEQSAIDATNKKLKKHTNLPLRGDFRCESAEPLQLATFLRSLSNQEDTEKPIPSCSLSVDQLTDMFEKDQTVAQYGVTLKNGDLPDAYLGCPIPQHRLSSKGK